MQLYSFQLGHRQTWQTWPETTSLQQFLAGGQGDTVLELTITLLMTDVSSEVAKASENIDSAHTSLTESMETLRSSLLDYNLSTVIDDTFVRYASCHRRSQGEHRVHVHVHPRGRRQNILRQIYRGKL